MLWDGDKVTDIGNLGGAAWHTPNAINRDGDIVGFSNFSQADGGNLRPHAFLWTESDGIADLGTLPAPLDDNSDAWGINKHRQVVGSSCDLDGNCHAYLWQDGAMADLNELVDSDDVLIAAYDIDSRGRISARHSTMRRASSSRLWLSRRANRRSHRWSSSPGKRPASNARTKSPRSITNADWWRAKLAATRERDLRNTQTLKDAGWTVLRIWEHEDTETAAGRASDALQTIRATPR